jgi:hypothetical protein
MKKLLLAFMVAIGFAAQVSAETLAFLFEKLFVQKPNSGTCAMLYDLVTVHEAVEQMRAEREQQEEMQKQAEEAQKWQLEETEKQQLEDMRNKQELKKVKKSILAFELRNRFNFSDKKQDVLAYLINTYKTNRE